MCGPGLLQSCVSLCLAGDAALDGGLIHPIDPQPGEGAANGNSPEGVSPQGVRIKAALTQDNTIQWVCLHING